MPSVVRAALVHAIKDAIGRLDENGTDIVGFDEVPLSELPRRRGKTPEEIKAISEMMIENDLQNGRLKP